MLVFFGIYILRTNRMPSDWQVSGISHPRKRAKIEYGSTENKDRYF